LISEAPGQTVEPDLANERYIVTNAPGGDPQITATFDETQKNLAATTEIPVNHPKVVSLAKEAVSGADTTAEKVARLVRFVQLYIEDDLSAEPLTLLDVIVRRKGDCSEHALLFTALARALRIPCRMVAGLVYGGDTLRAFSPHAWNEVVVNGQWIPVDPTWGQTTIDATHLRFPASVNEWYQVLGTVPTMKITVVDFEIK
jgi:transglutaminase-like putative cysteine protease